MGIQKKHAKARLDKYYYLAKEKGYRARAAFKLIQLNKKYSFLQSSKCLIDLCAAPGSWLQVAAETMPVKSIIIGVDLAPIKPIPKTITFQDDITSDKCRSTIRGHLKGWKADTVVHDGAPNVGVAWVQDAFSQNELVLASLKLATDFLAPNGTFVTKVFRSKDSAKLEWIFKQLFNRVEQTKPPSSRNVSAETFYVCRGYRAPKHIDSRFLDPKYAFAEVETAAVNNEARVFNPEKKRKKREGYEEGDWTQFHEAPASAFIQTQDPIEMLGRLNKLHFRQESGDDIALAALERLPETTKEVRLCCDDLKVLGRKEFKLLLRWRLKAREIFGMRQKKVQGSAGMVSGSTEDPAPGAVGEEVAVVESMDDEMRLQEEIQHMKDMQDKSRRKERRKDNERKQKEIVRMQMNMTTPAEIGIEAGQSGDSTFRLKDVDSSDVRRQIVRGRMVAPPPSEDASRSQAPPKVDLEQADVDEVEDEEEDELERQLDNLYVDYQDRREDRDTKARAKRARRMANPDEEEEFEGFDADEQGAETDASSDADLIEDDSADDLDSGNGDHQLLTDIESRQQSKDGLSGRAASFFQQDIFKDIGGLADLEEESEAEVEPDSGVDVTSPELKVEEVEEKGSSEVEELFDHDEDSEDEDIPAQPAQANEEDWQSDNEESSPHEKGRPHIDIITAEAMTLAQALATGKITKYSLTDDTFNKFSHRDVDGLPEWFLDDENKHSRPQRPVTAEAAKAIKEKLRALNARPIKKVREAKARKNMRAARRLEKLKRKSEGLAEGGDLSERDKASSISALMAKAKKSGNKKRKEVKVVKAGGVNKGQGRPRGVKGKYKMVDSRLKKDVRAEKRLSRKIKG